MFGCSRWRVICDERCVGSEGEDLWRPRGHRRRKWTKEIKVENREESGHNTREDRTHCLMTP